MVSSSSYKGGILSILFIFPSLFHLCLSDGGGNVGSNVGGNVTGNLDQFLADVDTQVQSFQDAKGQAQCMQKLVPCQPFLKSPINPPPICCEPLSEMANNGKECLCSFLNDPKMLSTLNISKDEVAKLPKACGVDVDVSKCNSGNSGNSGSLGNSGAQVAQVVGKETQNASSSTRITSPYGITLFGVPGFVTMLIVLVFSAY